MMLVLGLLASVAVAGIVACGEEKEVKEEEEAWLVQ